MNLPEVDKVGIQCFAYFLFKGTVDPRLIAAKYDYLDKLLNDPELLYNCFEVFAYAAQTGGYKKPEHVAADYIIGLHGQLGISGPNLLARAKEFNERQNTYWTDFLILAKWFCHNSFPNPLADNYVKGLHIVELMPLLSLLFGLILLRLTRS